MAKKKDVESTVREIRRKTRKKYSAEEKIRIVLEGLRGESTIAELCRAKAFIPTCTTSGSRNFWKRESSVCSEIPSERQVTRKCSQYAPRTNSSSNWWLIYPCRISC